MINWIVLFVLIGVGIFDLWLYFTDQKTLSQGWVFDKPGININLPKWVLRTIMIILLGLTWWLFGGVGTFVKVLIGVIIGHVLWQD